MLQQLILIEFSLRFQSRNKFCTCAVQSRHSYIYMCAYTNDKFMLCVRVLCVVCAGVNALHLCVHRACHGTWIMWVNECLICIYIVLNFGIFLLNYFSFVFLFWNRISILLRMENFSGYRVFFFSYSSEEIINENLLNVCNFRFFHP